jgi:hypothetical protein
LVAWNLLPAFRSITNQGYFRLLFFVFAMFWLISSLLLYNKYFFELLRITFLGVIYIVFMSIYIIFDNGDATLSNLIAPLIIFLYVYIGYYYFSIANRKTINIILLIMSIFFLMTVTTSSFYLLTTSLNVSRMLTSSSTDFEVTEMLRQRNIGAYDYVYGIIIILPAIILAIKENLPRTKLFLYLVLISFLGTFMVILSNFLIAYILLFLILFSMIIMLIKKNIYILLILIIVLVMVLPIIDEIILFVLNFAKELTPSIMTKMKINNIIYFISDNNTNLSDVTARGVLLKNSLISFLDSPMFGIGAYYHNSYLVGNHSQIIDDLSRYGIFGSLPFYLFIFLVLRKYYRELKKGKDIFLISCIIFITLSFLNPVDSYGIAFSVFIVLPLIIKSLQRDRGGLNK